MDALLIDAGVPDEMRDGAHRSRRWGFASSWPPSEPDVLLEDRGQGAPAGMGPRHAAHARPLARSRLLPRSRRPAALQRRPRAPAHQSERRRARAAAGQPARRLPRRAAPGARSRHRRGAARTRMAVPGPRRACRRAARPSPQPPRRDLCRCQRHAGAHLLGDHAPSCAGPETGRRSSATCVAPRWARRSRTSCSSRARAGCAATTRGPIHWYPAIGGSGG